MIAFTDYILKIKIGETLSEDDMGECIAHLMSGEVTQNQAAEFLTILHKRGETAEEIAGAARTMRKMAHTIHGPRGAIDCCGTGGDGHSTYNISTAVALVAAACGVPIAKHGNRSSTSKSGAADVLEYFGINLAMPEEKLIQALHDLHFCFMMAPNHHQAMKHLAPVRKSLGHRTIFNLLGPLANPAGTQKQLIGVYDQKWLRPIAEALRSLGTQKALIVHGEDGLDEITLTGKTYAVILDHGAITETTFLPQDFGLPRIELEDIKGGDAVTNAIGLKEVLKGKHNAYRSMVLANTAAVLNLHDNRDLKTGVRDAAEAIDTGKAMDVLNKYKEISA